MVFSDVTYKESLIHGTKHFPVQYYGSRLKPSVQDVPLHWHDEMEIIFIQKGAGTFHVNFETYHVRTHDILLIPKGALHEGHGHEIACDCHTIVFHQHFLASVMVDQLETNYLQPLFENLDEPVVLIESTHPHHESLMTVLTPLFQTLRNQPCGYELMTKGLLLQFLGLLYTHQLIKPNPLYSKPNKKLATLKTIITYVNMHYQEPIKIEDLATLVGYSNEHFMRFFKQEMGMKFTDYLNFIRLQNARLLLLQNEKHITDIALHCGFENLSYFCKKYKQIYFETPTQTRKSIES